MTAARTSAAPTLFAASVALALGAALAAPRAEARDEMMRMSIPLALATPEAQEVLDKGVKFYFGDTQHPPIQRSAGSFTSRKKSNSFGKADEGACRRAFLSALRSFQERVGKEGGNAVVKLKSYLRKQTFSSSTEYECASGALMSSVALQGEVVTLK